MKKLLLLLVLALTFTTSNAQTFGDDYLFASDNFVEIDKQYHFVGGAIFGSVGYMLGLDLHDGDRSKAIWTGIQVGTGVNLLKEVTDIGGSGFNTTDLAFGIVGSVASAWLTDKLLYPKYKSRQERELARIKAKDEEERHPLAIN